MKLISAEICFENKWESIDLTSLISISQYKDWTGELIMSIDWEIKNSYQLLQKENNSSHCNTAKGREFQLLSSKRQFQIALA